MSALDTAIEHAPAATRQGLWSEQRGLTVGLLLIVTLVAFEMLAVATVMPTARDDLGGVRLYGWTFSGFTLASIVGIVWSGQQSDRRGPAFPFAAGLVFFSTGLVVAGLAPSMAVLVLGRAIQGVGAGALPAVAWVVIGRAYREDVRPRMLSLMSSAWVVPGLTGPGIAAIVAETLTWRLVFLGLLPLVAVAAVLAFPGLRRLGPPATHADTGRRLLQATLLAVAATLFLAGLTSASPLMGVPLAIAGAALLPWPLRHLLPSGTLRAARGLPAAIAGHGLLNLAFICGDAFVPYAMVTVRGQSTILVGVALSVSTLTWTAGTWATERLGKRIERRRLMSVGLALVAIEMLAMAVAVAPSVPQAFAFVAWSVGTLGMGIAYPSFSLTIIGEAREGAEGAISASMKLVESLGGGVGAGVGGALVALGAVLATDAWGVAAAFLFAAAMAFAGILPALRSRPRGELVH